jgi:uncharacterized protein
VDPSLIVLGVLTVTVALAAAAYDPRLLASGLRGAGRLFRGVWLELVLGFVLAGLIGVLVPQQALLRALGPESGWRGIGAGWLIGLLLPGGPYVLFPALAGLIHQGAAVGPLITLISAKTLVSPLRMLTYEAPLLGWPITLARLIPGLLAAPLLGLAGQWLWRLLARPAP